MIYYPLIKFLVWRWSIREHLFTQHLESPTGQLYFSQQGDTNAILVTGWSFESLARGMNQENSFIVKHGSCYKNPYELKETTYPLKFVPVLKLYQSTTIASLVIVWTGPLIIPVQTSYLTTLKQCSIQLGDFASSKMNPSYSPRHHRCLPRLNAVVLGKPNQLLDREPCQQNPVKSVQKAPFLPLFNLSSL